METHTEFEQIETFMQNRNIARAKDLREFGISGTAISRATAEGILIRLSRGIYTTADANMKPKSGFPKIRSVRFREPYYSGAVSRHSISSIDVPIYTLEKTLADAFRNPKLVDRSVAIEALKTTLAERKSTPAKIAEAAKAYSAWNKMAPYLEALTANG